jgi:cytochrome b
MNTVHQDKVAESTSKPTWDLLVRVGHWLLAVAFVTAWIAGDDYQQVHVYAGYTLAVVLLVRFVWGLIGPRNARFTQFIHGPAAVFRYLRSLLTGEPEAHSGHNPAGGWMVVALLLALTIQVGSGMTLYALEEGKGPLAGLIASESPVATVEGPYADSHEADEDEHEGRRSEESAFEEAVEEVHEFGADLLLVLVALHITGVVVSSMLHRENFVRGMITGRRTRHR